MDDIDVQDLVVRICETPNDKKKFESLMGALQSPQQGGAAQASNVQTWLDDPSNKEWFCKNFQGYENFLQSSAAVLKDVLLENISSMMSTGEKKYFDEELEFTPETVNELLWQPCLKTTKNNKPKMVKELFAIKSSSVGSRMMGREVDNEATIKAMLRIVSTNNTAKELAGKIGQQYCQANSSTKGKSLKSYIRRTIGGLQPSNDNKINALRTKIINSCDLSDLDTLCLVLQKNLTNTIELGDSGLQSIIENSLLYALDPKPSVDLSSIIDKPIYKSMESSEKGKYNKIHNNKKLTLEQRADAKTKLDTRERYDALKDVFQVLFNINGNGQLKSALQHEDTHDLSSGSAATAPVAEQPSDRGAVTVSIKGAESPKTVGDPPGKIPSDAGNSRPQELQDAVDLELEKTTRNDDSLHH